MNSKSHGANPAGKAPSAKKGLNRSRAGHSAARADHKERWAISYADLLTILLVFFIAGAARMSATHVDKTVTATEASQPLSEALRRLKGLGVEAHLTKEGLVIRLPNEIHFEPGDDAFSEESIAALAPVGEVLKGLPNRIRVAGYADSTPIHNARFRDNWELAAKRGLALLGTLSSRFGISEAQLSVETFGAHAPRQSNETSEGRADNRRVEILLLN